MGGKSFSLIPPPPIIRQQQRERSHPISSEEDKTSSRPPSETFYDSVPSEVDVIRSTGTPTRQVVRTREASPYEESASNNQVINEVEEEDDDDPLIEEILSYTTSVVKSVMVLGAKLSNARPADYIELVKVHYIQLELLIVGH